MTGEERGNLAITLIGLKEIEIQNLRLEIARLQAECGALSAQLKDYQNRASAAA